MREDTALLSIKKGNLLKLSELEEGTLVIREDGMSRAVYIGTQKDDSGKGTALFAQTDMVSRQKLLRVYSAPIIIINSEQVVDFKRLCLAAELWDETKEDFFRKYNLVRRHNQ